MGVVCVMGSVWHMRPVIMECDHACFGYSLHDEVLAQKALDRKLTAELNKFRGKITTLTQ